MRWRVVSNVMLQGISIIALAVSINTLPKSREVGFSGSGCECFEMIWWGSINTCTGASWSFWLYFYLRTSSWLLESWLALSHSRYYAAARKISDGQETVSEDTLGLAISPCVYHSIPSTTSSSYLLSLVALLSTCISIEVSLASINSKNNYLLKTWGQTAQLFAFLWSVYRWTQQLAAMFTIHATKRRQAALDASSIGTLIPEIGFIGAIDSKKGLWEVLLMCARRVYKNHPFGSLPPRRRPDHARFCEESEGWKKIQLDFRQWPNTSENDKGQMLLDGARLGDLTLVSNLLCEGAPKNFINDDGHSALRLAIDFDQLHIMRKLLEQGCDTNVSDLEKLSPLHAAAEKGNDEVLKLLLEHGANILAVGGLNQWTSLHVAARHGQAKNLIALLSHGAYTEAKDRKGMTALHLVVRHGQEELIDVLVGNCDLNAVERKGKTALWIASRHNRLRSLKILLENHADPNIVDVNRNWAPIHVAARHDRNDVAKLLLEHGCVTTQKDKEEQKTALQIAVNYGREEIVDLLLQFDIQLDETDHRNRTALYWACKDDRQATRKLLRKGANVQTGDTTLLRELLGKYGQTNEQVDILIQERMNEKILEILSDRVQQQKLWGRSGN